LKKTTKSVRIYRHLTQTNFTMDWSFIIFLAVWITLQFWVFPKLGIPTWGSRNTCRVPVSKKNIAESGELLEDPNKI